MGLDNGILVRLKKNAPAEVRAEVKKYCVDYFEYEDIYQIAYWRNCYFLNDVIKELMFAAEIEPDESNNYACDAAMLFDIGDRLDYVNDGKIWQNDRYYEYGPELETMLCHDHQRVMGMAYTMEEYSEYFEEVTFYDSW